MANGAMSTPRGFQKCNDCNAVGPPCHACHGTGKVKGATCDSCKGTGLEVHTTIIESCKG
jgi:DnaJ-class molecular chaperone